MADTRTRLAKIAARSVLRILTGRLTTGNVARLTIYSDGKCLLERQDYVSDNADGWRKQYEPTEGEVKDYYWLENQLQTNPAEWLE